MKRSGAFIVVLLTGFILTLLFYETILHAGKVSFADGGDGLKSTFGTIYHLRHDTTYWHTDAMNYPFGESVFFTGNQVLFTNTLKLVQDITGSDLSERVLGISNLWLLFSFVLCALFVYLIMAELKLPWWYAVLGGVIITLLSTQWERLSGHYNLAFAFAIPVPVYILLRFHKKPAYLISLLFGFYMVIISARHLYFAVIIVLLMIPFWIYMIISERDKVGNWYHILLHLMLQIFIPLTAFSIFSGIQDSAMDRTAFPWGFYFSRMKVEAVFLPVGLSYGKFLNLSYPYRSTSYVSLLGTLVFLVIIIRLFIYLIRRDYKRAFQIGESNAFTWIFWGSVVCLLLSLGLPFSQGYEKLLNYTGPFRQFRAIGRFVFPFYYMMTITAFYLLWLWYSKSDWKWKQAVLIIALLATAAESALNVRERTRKLSYTIETLNDWDNKLEQDNWVSQHDWSMYQAIMPIPYFHVGSENYWINDFSPAAEDAYVASIKTGLPLNSVMLSRTSISHTLLNLAFYYEPTSRYEILDYLPNKKPYLILVSSEGNLNSNEQRIIQKSTLLEKTGRFNLFSFYPDSLNALIKDFQSELRNKMESENDSSWFYINSFDDQSEGHFSAPVADKTTILDQVIPYSGNYKVSFRVDKMDQDLWPRLILYVDLYDSKGGSGFHKDLFKTTVQLDRGWGLFEFDLHVNDPGSRLVVYLKNKYLIKGDQVLDHLIIRPADKNVVFEDDGKTYVNGRLLFESI